MKRFEATAAFITGFYLAATMGANANEYAIRMSSVSNNTSDYTLEIAINQMGFDRPDQPASARIAPKKSAIITSKSPSSVSQCFYNIRVNYYGATGERFSEKERYLENIDFCKTEIPVDSQGDFTISESMFIADGPDRIIISDGLGAAGAAKPATQSIQASGDAPGPASQQAGRPYARPAPVVVPPPGARRLPGGGFFADTLVAGAQMSASRTSPASAPASRPSVVARPAAAAPAASAPASSPQPGPPLGSGVSVGSGIPTTGATPPTMAAGGATIALANPQPGLPPQPYVLPQPNPSQVAPSGGAKDARIVEFLFATNRSRPDPSRPTEFSFGRMPSLTLGAVRVRVPEDHKIGRIELPGNYKVLSFTIWKDEFQKEKHFKVDQIVTINRERWLEQISSNPDGEVLIFVHGFNTTFEDSVYRAAQIAWDLQYPGTMILFSWPSRGNSVAHYDYDQNSALNARDRFLDLVTLVQTETKTKRVHVIAHSMGNRVVVDALANYGKTTNPRKINELIMASPDIDQDLFLGQISDLEKVTAGMTLYASSTDKAMIAARNVSMAPKAGDFNQNKIMELKTVDLIDTSAIGEEMFGLNHTSFAERRSLINDIKLIIRRGLRPPNERLPEIRGMPPGVTGRPSFWRFVL